MLPVDRISVRRTLRKHFAPRRLSITELERQAIGSLVSRDDVLNALHAIFVERCRSAGRQLRGGVDVAGFIAWLVDHWLDVLRVILALIPLFVGEGADIDAEMMACCDRDLMSAA